MTPWIFVVIILLIALNVVSVHAYRITKNARNADDIWHCIDVQNKTKIISLESKIDELKMKNTKLNDELSAFNARELAVMKEINAAMTQNSIWGDTNKNPFPGGLSVKTENAEFDETGRYGTIRIGTVFQDIDCEKFLLCKSNATRAEFALAYLKRTGILDRLVMQMLKSGCVEMSFATKDGTSIQVYYNIMMKVHDNTVINQLPSELR